jgi:polyisoprenoid-binding protein YceI
VNTWTIDPSHSTLSFKVRHMAISVVHGSFKRFTFTAATDERGRPSQLEATIEADSVDTGDAQRDAHLKTADFFDVAQYPTLRFASSSIEELSPRRYRVTGELEMRGQRRPLLFEVEITEPIRDPYGNTRVGVTAQGTLSRKAWGLSWNQALELGGVLVGDEVGFAVDAQAIAARERDLQPA